MGGDACTERALYLHVIHKVHRHLSPENKEPSSRGDQKDQINGNHPSLFWLISHLYGCNPLTIEFSDMKEEVTKQQEKRINPEHVSVKYNFSWISTHQSSLLKIMNPLFPLPKATWLLPLSHQLVKGSPSTTLRNMTMFLKAKHGRVAMHTPTVWQKALSKFIIRRSHKWGAPPDLTPAMLTDPVIAAGGVGVNSDFFNYSINIWWPNPVINILHEQKEWKHAQILNVSVASSFSTLPNPVCPVCL